MAKKKVSPFIKMLHDRKFSLRTFGAKVSIDFTYLSRMARGERIPTLIRARKISRALGITLEELFQSLPKAQVKHG